MIAELLPRAFFLVVGRVLAKVLAGEPETTMAMDCGGSREIICTPRPHPCVS
jgi:hypothetical protein